MTDEPRRPNGESPACPTPGPGAQRPARTRNLVTRADGKVINVARQRGVLFVCATGCCCGHTERGHAPVPTDLYHSEWERRKLRNRVHLSQGGCLGPCPLANVAMLMFDGRAIGFHSVNDPRLVLAIYDYIEQMLAAGGYLPPPPALADHVFSGFSWDEPASAAPPLTTGSGGFLFLTHADTDLLALSKVIPRLPPDFPPVRAANPSFLKTEADIDSYLNAVAPSAEVVILRLLGGRNSFAHGIERLLAIAREHDQFFLPLPGTDTLDPELTALATVDVPTLHEAFAYLQLGGLDNYEHLLRFLADHLLTTGYGYDAPRPQPRHGVYHPDLPEGTLAAWQARRQARDAQPAARNAPAGAASAPRSPRPVLGVLFYRSHFLAGNTDFVDALVREGEARGADVLPVYAYSLKETEEDGQEGTGIPAALRYFLDEQGRPIVDVLITTMSFAMGGVNPDGPTPSGWSVEVLRRLDVPVLQAITASATEAAWSASGRGLGPLDTAMNVALPEFDGRIIGVPISFKEGARADGISGPSPVRYLPHPERVARLVGLALNLANLRRLPNQEKRIAFVLTNSTAKASRIGNAVGLDAPASLLRILQAMKEAGYRIGDLPASGDELIQQLIDRCSYDVEVLTEEQLGRAVGRVPEGQYARWFGELPARSGDRMAKQWGPPPGGAYVHDGAIALAGLEFGNAIVVLQPPRGYGMDPNTIYHSPDLPPPHNYHALYRWLRDPNGWGAHAIVHVGKHGTLEWLPGKAVGLSGECYPDLFLADLPLVYPFILNNPGEGAQAKRRTHAVIVDHMTPPMTHAGAYGELAELAQLVDEYYQVELLDPAKLPLLQQQIWDLLRRTRLDSDLKLLLTQDHGDHRHEWDEELTEDGTPASLAEMRGRDFAHLMEDIDGYLCELTGAQIRDGLHILGEVPRGEALVGLLAALTRVPNLDVPSLRAGVAAAFGLEIAALDEAGGRRLAHLLAATPEEERARAAAASSTTGSSASAKPGSASCHSALSPQPSALDPALAADARVAALSAAAGRPLVTAADAVEAVDDLCRRLLSACAERGFAPSTVPAAMAAVLGERARGADQVRATLAFVCEELVPNLERIPDEIGNLLHALDGGYVPAGPSGAPTRGMAHVLPTGRNFYAVDPRALPSVAAWRVGEALARELVARHLAEEGTYPERVGLSIWGTSAMRTHGDDIAEVFALLGVRPRWQAENRRLVGIEVIPLEELGRPRIDVVCRISGFFRDAFPHLIALIDEAVRTVAELDEPVEQNFVRKRYLADRARHQREGLDEARARQRALYRIFGPKPGSYGAGILPLIDERHWQGLEDFAAAYVAWGGYAYTPQEYGTEAQEEFRHALATVAVAAKNQDNREHDIFDADDYLQYHGGMIATIRALTGKAPRRYFGDTADPARPRVRDLKEEALRVFRSRVVNPKWIASVQRHGYKGALEMAATVDYLFGYDATSDVVDDWMYERLTQSYVLDPATREFFRRSNPWALRDIAARLLEAIDRGLWEEPSEEMREALQQAYLETDENLEARGESPPAAPPAPFDGARPAGTRPLPPGQNRGREARGSLEP